MSNFYKTRPGDTISKIIEKYNTSFTDFEKLNDIKKLTLFNQQIILVPLPENHCIKLSQHRLTGTETIADILLKYKVEYDALKYFNNLPQLILNENQIVNVERKFISPVLGNFTISIWGSKNS